MKRLANEQTAFNNKINQDDKRLNKRKASKKKSHIKDK